MLRARLRALTGGIVAPFEARRRDDGQLSFHIDARADDLMERSGISRKEALRRARLEFGSIERYKEEEREARGLRGCSTGCARMRVMRSASFASIRSSRLPQS